jgi:UDPglucose 6-dehydrogenase
VFEHNTRAIIVDPKYSRETIEDIVKKAARITFVALPAPTLDDGTVDAGLIYTVFKELQQLKYRGVVVLKSTLPPTIVDDLFNIFTKDKTIDNGKLRYVYSPEFLREAHWEDDVLKPDQIILAGEYNDCAYVRTIYMNHSHLSKHVRYNMCDYKEAALAKYAINAYLASKVVFMNQLHPLYTDICGPSQPETWKYFIDMIVDDSRIGDTHTDVPGNDGKFGYGGSCFPKDVKALIGADKEGRLSVLREVELANTKIRLTGSMDS